jgi:hypothetical protein
MGVTSAIGAGLSAVSGVIGLSQQQKQAKAQKEMLDAQEAQQRLQAQLQLFSLKNQRVIDDLQDTLSDAANKQAYLQTDAGLRLQQQMNQMATQNAIFGSQMQQMQGDIGERQKQMQVAGQRSAQNEQVEGQFTEALGGVGSESNQFLSALLKGIQESENPRGALTTLMDVAASSGGINESLAMLLDSDAFAAQKNAYAANRMGEVGQQKIVTAQGIRGAGQQLNDVAAQLGLASAGLENSGIQFQSKMGILDANTAQQVSDNSFSSQRLANDQNYRTGIMAGNIQRSSRYLQSRASEEALQQGQVLSAETLAAQKSAIQSPGLFDYLGVGMNAYNTYNSLSQRPPTLRGNA